MKFQQSKGNNSYFNHDSLMKLHMHNHTMVVYNQYKFHEFPSIGYLVMAEVRKSLKFRQSKGYNSDIKDDTPIKLHVHNFIIVIYIQYKFHEFPSIGYLVMAEGGKTNEQRNWKDGRTTPATTGDNKNKLNLTLSRPMVYNFQSPLSTVLPWLEELFQPFHLIF